MVTPILLYDPSNGLTKLPGQSLMWKGKIKLWQVQLIAYHCVWLGGYVPKDAPSPVVQATQSS